ncbi:MAG TPA: transcription termination factor Rho [Lachnospiraceae bacterium]|nr:transcription termination factor Rho [Lachnospiraceae bacterium]
MEDLEGLSLVDLRLVAKKMGVKSVTSYRKQELLDLLKEKQKEESAAKVSEEKTADKKESAKGKRKTTGKEKAEKKETVTEQTEQTEKQKEAAVERTEKKRAEKNTSVEHNVKEDDKRNAYNKKAMSRYNEKQQRKENGRKEGRRTEEAGTERQQKYTPTEMEQLDSGEVRNGILEVLSEGYGFIRCDNYLPGEEDVYVSPALIRKYHLRTGDILEGNIRVRNQNEKFGALLYIKTVNGYSLEQVLRRPKFEQLTPIFPNERIRLETPGSGISMRMMDLISPIGKGQRGMIVSQPKTGKTTLLKQVAKAVKTNHPKMHIIVLLIDERPEEVTDIKESIMGHNVEVIYSTFDELPENHKRVSEMVIERAKRLVEHGEEVMILLDSITRLARAYNLTVVPSGRTLSGGLDPAALHMPKRFFGAARNMREGGNLTILATALVDTGSKMDDVVFEEFKGTGNMELVLDRSLSEKRVFPAIDLQKSSTRREDLLLTQEEIEATFLMRKAFGGSRSDEAVERIIDMFRKTKNNYEFIQLVKKVKIV